MRAGGGGGRAAALMLALAGCATREVAEAPAGEAPAAPTRFEVTTAGAIGIAVLTGVVVLALIVSSDEGASFD